MNSKSGFTCLIRWAAGISVLSLVCEHSAFAREKTWCSIKRLRQGAVEAADQLNGSRVSRQVWRHDRLDSERRDRIISSMFTPDSSTLVTCLENGTLGVAKAPVFDEPEYINVGNAAMLHAASTADSRKVFVSAGTEVALVDIQSMKVKWSYRHAGLDVARQVIAKEPLFLANRLFDGGFILSDKGDHAILAFHSDEVREEPPEFPFAISDDGKTLYSISEYNNALFAYSTDGGSEKLFAVDDPQFAGRRNPTLKRYFEVSLFKDFVIGHNHEHVIVWNVKNKKIASRLRCVPSKEFFGRLALSPDGKMVAIATETEKGSGQLVLYSFPQLERLSEIDNGECYGREIVFSPNGQWLAAQGEFKTAIWNVSNWENVIRIKRLPVFTLNGERCSMLGQLAFSANGKWLVVGGVFPELFELK